MPWPAGRGIFVFALEIVPPAARAIHFSREKSALARKIARFALLV
jgi:hypothetical protein